MQFVSEWATPDQRMLVVFAPQALQTLVEHRQGLDGEPERGGVLLGLRRGNHLEVTVATPPGPMDKGSQFHFAREPAGHDEVASSTWHASGRVVDYLGEWHTHPQLVPSPSSLDRREWRKLSRKLAVRTGLLAVVVGMEKLHVELALDKSFLALAPLA